MHKCVLVVFLALSSFASALVKEDKVSYKDLGMSEWTPAFDTYSGYVTVNNLPIKVNMSDGKYATAVDHHMHYM